MDIKFIEAKSIIKENFKNIEYICTIADIWSGEK